MIGIFFFGMFCGGVIIATLAAVFINSQDKWFNGRLDYWAARVTELQEHVNDLQQREDERDDSSERWKHADD